MVLIIRLTVNVVSQKRLTDEDIVNSLEWLGEFEAAHPFAIQVAQLSLFLIFTFNQL
ncbi:hypothetical protein [Thioflexithrix psekupsensis]|uniref:hypothetical protein n=1 Tax=Thioflexithrix psekupsensis TaxID=1570016 RepID=UPI001593C536|nr:hypothetical protein [Thioflexithrix psekupsensis]